MKIYITRHGETQWNKERRMQGSQNSSLTAKGIADAKKLQGRLAGVPFDRIYASPLGRALETARILRGDRNLPIEEVPDFREMHFGLWEGRTLGEVEGVYGEGYRNFWEAPEKFQPVEGESFEDLLQRVDQGLSLLERENSRQGVCLLVAHAVVIKAIYALVKNLPLKEFWNPPFMHGTNLSILEMEKGGQRRFLLEGDITHLQQE